MLFDPHLRVILIFQLCRRRPTSHCLRKKVSSSSSASSLNPIRWEIKAGEKFVNKSKSRSWGWLPGLFPQFLVSYNFPSLHCWLLDSKNNINPQVMQPPLMFNKLSIAGSLIGGLVETQECIDFCAKHNIVPSIKKVTVKDIEGVYKQLSAKNDAIVRNVLDIEASKWWIPMTTQDILKNVGTLPSLSIYLGNV